MLAFPLYLPSTSLPPLTQLPAGATGSAESWHREREEGVDIALTDQAGLERVDTGWVYVQQPWGKRVREAHAWVPGWVSWLPAGLLTRLQSWPSTLLLAWH